MAARIIVGFLTRVGAETADAVESYVKRVNELAARAEALGGRVSAFGSRSVAFEFAEDELEEAIALALGTKGTQGGSLSPFRIGISEGEVTPIASAGALATFSWGPPLVTAIALARIARPGAVLIDPAVPAVGRGDVATPGARGVVAAGAPARSREAARRRRGRRSIRCRARLAVGDLAVGRRERRAFTRRDLDRRRDGRRRSVARRTRDRGRVPRSGGSPRG